MVWFMRSVFFFGKKDLNSIASIMLFCINKRFFLFFFEKKHESIVFMLRKRGLWFGLCIVFFARGAFFYLGVFF